MTEARQRASPARKELKVELSNQSQQHYSCYWMNDDSKLSTGERRPNGAGCWCACSRPGEGAEGTVVGSVWGVKLGHCSFRSSSPGSSQRPLVEALEMKEACSDGVATA
jgi:hypothetical protein